MRLSHWNRAIERHGFASILQLKILFFSYCQNNEILFEEIQEEIYRMAKARCEELQSNKNVMVCALIDRVDVMDDFESQICKKMYDLLSYGTDNLIDKNEKELSQMLVIAEAIVGTHCNYPSSLESHCSASRAIALRKNQLSFKCDDNEPNGCENCEYCSMTTPCQRAYDTWIARDISKEKCKDGSLRYGFIKEMLQLYINPDVEYEFCYPKGTFDDVYEEVPPEKCYYNEYTDIDDDEEIMI